MRRLLHHITGGWVLLLAFLNAVHGQTAQTMEREVRALELPTETVQLPLNWTVFTYVNPEAAEDITAFTEIPLELPGEAGEVRGSVVQLENTKIEFAGVAGFHRLKAAALAFAVVDAPEACEMTVGAASDWWMQWALNGKIVCDTLKRGNAGRPQSVLGFRFKLALRQGRNLIVCKVLSGSRGWVSLVHNPLHAGGGYQEHGPS